MTRKRKNYRFSDETIGYLTWLTGITGKDETAIVEEAIYLLAATTRVKLKPERGRGRVWDSENIG